MLQQLRPEEFRAYQQGEPPIASPLDPGLNVLTDVRLRLDAVLLRRFR